MENEIVVKEAQNFVFSRRAIYQKDLNVIDLLVGLPMFLKMMSGIQH